MENLRDGKTSTLGDFAVALSDLFFVENHFVLGNVNTKTYILLLAKQAPRSFVSGVLVDLAKTLKESNRTEFHHLMPKAYLKSSNQTTISENILANFAFLSRSDNRLIGGVAPSAYRSKIGGDETTILSSAVCPISLFDDKYPAFIEGRKMQLLEKANELIL
jgi:hypothetical protein